MRLEFGDIVRLKSEIWMQKNTRKHLATNIIYSNYLNCMLSKYILFSDEKEKMLQKKNWVVLGTYGKDKMARLNHDMETISIPIVFLEKVKSSE